MTDKEKIVYRQLIVRELTRDKVVAMSKKLRMTVDQFVESMYQFYKKESKKHEY